MPPTCTAWPSRYFEVEWMTMSAPYSMGLHSTGVAKVESTISGTPWSWAMRANFSTSRTLIAGFAMISPNRAFVFGLNAAAISASEAFWST